MDTKISEASVGYEIAEIEDDEGYKHFLFANVLTNEKEKKMFVWLSYDIEITDEDDVRKIVEVIKYCNIHDASIVFDVDVNSSINMLCKNNYELCLLSCQEQNTHLSILFRMLSTSVSNNDENKTLILRIFRRIAKKITSDDKFNFQDLKKELEAEIKSREDDLKKFQNDDHIYDFYMNVLIKVMREVEEERIKEFREEIKIIEEVENCSN